MHYVQYLGAGIATINSIDVAGAQGLGCSQLLVVVHLAMQPAKNAAQQAPRIVALHGNLLANGVLFASLQPLFDTLRCTPVGNSSRDWQRDLRAVLSPAQVRAVDEARDKNGDFTLKLELVAQVDGDGGIVACGLPIDKRVTASDWARVLREMKFEDRATFEVPIEGGRVSPPLDVAAKHMRDALDQVQKRDWPDALRMCREVFDELKNFQRGALPPLADWKDVGKRQAWTIPERILVAEWAIRELTHAGAHAKIGNAEEHEVRLAVAMTGAMLRYYASRGTP